MKFVSSILFAFMAMVLPMAAVSQYSCTSNIACAEDLSKCLDGDANCCGENDGNIPDCMIATELLPDAELPATSALTFLKADLSCFERLVIAELTVVRLDAIQDHKHRALPDFGRLYAEQQRLLI